MITEELETTGLVLGRYRMGRRLGAGGFGAVHEALDEALDRWVAVKVIPSDAETPVRARREAVAAARLEHPGIVAIFDAGEEDGARYLISELVEGRTLGQLEQAGELTDRDVLRVGLALSDALIHAHERGVIHRDLKPANILVPDRPRTWRGAAKLADFGVAMLAGDDPLTVTGDVVGTLAYMAPEQAAGKRVDHRADLYSLALVLYEALAGTNPNRGATPAATATKIGKPVASLAKARPDMPPELVAAIDTALHVAPAQRGTLDDLADALELALTEVDDEGGVVSRHPAETPVRIPRGTGRALHAGGAAAIVGVALFDQTVVPWPVAAAAAFVLVLALPRVGWLAAMIGGVAVLFADFDSDRALALAMAALPVPALLFRAPRAWSLPVLALAAHGAFPALAGQLRRFPERAAAGALGAWWLLLVQHQDALGRVGPFLPVIGVWAVAAAILPWVVRGRYLVFDVIAAAMWAAALASATATAAEALDVAQPRGLVAFTVLAALIAVASPRYSDE